jgi:hypothetical protein
MIAFLIYIKLKNDEKTISVPIYTEWTCMLSTGKCLNLGLTGKTGYGTMEKIQVMARNGRSLPYTRFHSKKYLNIRSFGTLPELSIFELILSQEKVISKLTKDKKNKLINEANAKFISKVQFAKNYGFWGIRTTPLLMGRVMKMNQFPELTELIFENNSVTNHLETGSLYDFKIMKEIADKATDYSNLK